MIRDVFFIRDTSNGECPNPFDNPVNGAIEYIRACLDRIPVAHNSVRIVVARGIGDQAEGCANRLIRRLNANGFCVSDKILARALFGDLESVGMTRNETNLSLLLARLMEFLCPYLLCLELEESVVENPQALCCVVGEDIMSLLTVICELTDKPKDGDVFYFRIRKSKTSIDWTIFRRGDSDPVKSQSVMLVSNMLLTLLNVGLAMPVVRQVFALKEAGE